MAEIEIKVKDCPVKPITELKNFQGELKRITPEALNKLKKSITKNGFNAPIFVWAGHDYILDGHQRISAINELMAEGWTIEKNSLPCVEITAKDKQQAAEMILTYNSQYGDLTKESLDTFVTENQLDLSELTLIVNMPILNIELPQINIPDTYPEKEITAIPTDNKCPSCGYTW
jgi:hypothetical protein